MDYSKANLKRIFKKFGLDEKETSIYLEALKHEELTPFALAKITGIPRTTVYDAIMSLSLKGLVELEESDGFQKQQTKIKAKNPSELRTILQKKREDLAHLEWDILNIMPFLKKDFHQDKSNSDFRFFPGIEGAKHVYQLSLANDLDLPVYSFDYLFESDIFGSLEMDKIVDKSLDKRPRKNKEKRIIPLTDWSKNVLSYQIGRNKDYLMTKDIRYVEDKVFIINQRIEISGSWVRIISVKEKEIWGLIINSKLLAQTLESIFNLVWRQATPITFDLVQSWGEDPITKAKKT